MATKSFSFAFTFVALFALSYLFLAWVDALPEPISNESGEAVFEQESSSSVQPQNASNEFSTSPQMPVRVVAESIGLNKTVANPESTDVETLDAALLKATVRYPTSAPLGVDGTVLIFGHSSYLPIVSNPNFKAFNGIQKLKVGAIISVFSATHEYRYAVTSVRLANAQEDVVELPSNGKFLTLVTCDSFGTKSARFVVTSTLAGVYAL